MPLLAKEIVDRNAAGQDPELNFKGNIRLWHSFWSRGKENNHNNWHLTHWDAKILLLLFIGFLVGNPGTTFYSIIPAGLDTYWGHQIVSKPLYDGFVQNCREAAHFNMTICEG